MIEYAYFDEIVKGNSREMVETLAKIKKFFDAKVITEFAYTSGRTSFFATREPIPVAVKVFGDIGEAKFQALILLKKLGFVRKDAIDLEDAFRFAEKIERMPMEEFLKELRKLKVE
uniref:Uncharacterized protein n=1 Tax=Archaeoglobus fulgidus TaxID=2234 RepID=A0A7J2TJE4_ARCFL